jgi:hypothetical protein
MALTHVAKNAAKKQLNWEIGVSVLALWHVLRAIKNSGPAAYVVGTPPAAAAGRSSRGYEFGLRHFF